MIAPLADTAELPRVTPVRAEAVAGAPLTGPGELAERTVPGKSAGAAGAPVPAPRANRRAQLPDRRAQREERRQARRRRRLAASLGLMILAAFLAGAIVVVGVVR